MKRCTYRLSCRAALTPVLLAVALLFSADNTVDAAGVGFGPGYHSRMPTQHVYAQPAYSQPPAQHAQAVSWPPRHGYYGFAHKDYGWGWFGACYRGRMYSHRGYYDNTYQWGYRVGY